MRIRLSLLAALAAAACVPVPASRAPDPSARPFPVFAFFEGRSTGTATLKVALRGAVPVHVESFGRIQGGVLALRQTIREGDKPPRTREWRIWEVAPDRFEATLSDAAGPVRAEAGPGLLHLAFRMKGGLDTEQWLTLSADGRSAHNVLTARKFGLVVAALEETIRKM